MPTIHPIAIILASACTASAAVAAGPNFSATAQSRSTSCSAFAENFNTGDSLSDGDADAAPDFAPFNSAISANADLFDSFTSSGAIQDAQINPLGISASGSAFATAENYGFDEFNDASGQSSCQVEFTLKADTYYILTARISASDSGGAQLSVTSGPSTITDYAASGPSEEFTISQASVIPAGNYTCSASASGSAYGDSFNSEYAFADYELTLTLTCPGDANLDGIVDVNDISYALFRLGTTTTPGQFTEGDTNTDGAVDVNDISYILFRLGNSCL